MFDSIGLGEILVVALVALLVAKPEDVPEIMRKTGVLVATLQAYVQGMWHGWQTEFTANQEKPDVN